MRDGWFTFMVCVLCHVFQNLCVCFGPRANLRLK